MFVEGMRCVERVSGKRLRFVFECGLGCVLMFVHVPRVDFERFDASMAPERASKREGGELWNARQGREI